MNTGGQMFEPDNLLPALLSSHGLSFYYTALSMSIWFQVAAESATELC